MKKIPILLASSLVGIASLVPASTSASSGTICTTDYMPVCGQPLPPPCPSGMQCVQVMPKPQTYGNTCLMNAAGATKISEGVCRGDDAPIADDIPVNHCNSASGYLWDDVLGKCVRPWEAETVFHWSREMGLTTTQNLTQFKPESTITRDEAAAFLLRASQKEILPPQMITPMQYPFSDAEKIAPEFRAAVQFVHNSRIMQGDNNAFLPKNFLTHLEALIVLTRAYQMDEGGVKTHPWYKPYLDEAKNVGIQIDESLLNRPIPRAFFMGWMRQYAEHFSGMKLDTRTVLPMQGEWKFREFLSSKNTKITLKKPVTLEVKNNQIAVQFCNMMRATAKTSEKNTLETGGFVSTKMYCEGDPMILEDAFRFNKAFWEFQDTENTLVIKTEWGTFFFDAVSAALPPHTKEFQGEWKLQSYKTLSGQTQNAPENISFTFKNNRIATKVCNYLWADFVATESVIKTQEFVTTEMYCFDATLREIEREIAFKEAQYTLSSDKKTLTLKTNGGYEFHFKK